MAGFVEHASPPRLDAEAQVVVVGAGACGLVAALKAHERGADVVVLERDASPSGSTTMSSGFVPAPATRYQRAAGIADDTPALFEADMMAKTKGRAVPHLARLAAQEIGPTLEWLGKAYGLDWIVLDDFLYPGHSRMRMHAVPEKTGAALLARLLAAVEQAGIPVVTQARARRLFAGGDGRIVAVEAERPGGAIETIGCRALVLACNGYGGNADLIARHIPEIAGGLYYGHAGNTGDAVLWGEALGARLEHLSAYQGHGSLAHPHGILISWALMGKGAIQVNTRGERFSDESGGYSEQAVKVLAQPGGIAWNVYGETVHDFALSFADYRQADAAGAIRSAADTEALARLIGAPADVLAKTLAAARLAPPYRAVRVTGALFHTQGGLMIDGRARVLSADGKVFPNLLAGGGAACGVSGPEVSGYLSGNGLLTAIAFGALAGETATQVDP